MVTISITAEAHAAIRSTLPKGVRAEPQLDEGGGFKITLDRHTLDRLTALRGPGESYSDVILRLAAGGRRRTAVAHRRPPAGGGSFGGGRASEGPPSAAGLFQVLALKGVPVYHLTIWTFNFLNSALLVKH